MLKEPIKRKVTRKEMDNAVSLILKVRVKNQTKRLISVIQMFVNLLECYG